MPQRAAGMTIDTLVTQPGAWLARGRDNGIVVSSRIRLARNVRGVAFPGWAGKEERVRLCRRLCECLAAAPAMEQPLVLEMARLEPLDRSLLVERHLISRELAERGEGSAVVVSRDEGLAAMVNEEDHLRLQAMAPGLELPALWERVNALDTGLERHMTYAFGERLGYLTACPTNVGTGLRASTMLHLVGLRLAGELEAVVKGLDRIGLAVRGIYGEGTEAFGHMFQISNQGTLGESESTILERLEMVVRDMVNHERNARARLLESRPVKVHDYIGRAIGVLEHARLLTSGEVLDFLSALRLGVELGLIKKLTTARLNEIMLSTQAAHLQKLTGRLLEQEPRDALRAGLVRQKLAGLVWSDGDDDNALERDNSVRIEP